MTYQLCIAQPTPQAETWHDASTLGIQLDGLILTRLHAEVDTLTLTLRGPSILTDDPLWNFNQVIRLRSYDGTDYTYLFLGRVQPFQRSATGADQATVIEIRGIWDWFDKTTMRQDWTFENWTGGDPVTHSAPRATLFWDPTETKRITTGQQIERCVSFAISAGCPIAAPQPGDIATGITPPYDEQLNISISQAINTCLSYHPHAVAWIDYSERSPRLRVAPRQSLPSFTAPLDASLTEELHITSREDLQPPAVAIAYQKPWADGEHRGIQTHVDYAPVIPGETIPQRKARLSRVDVLWAVYDLAGMDIQYRDLEQSLQTEPIAWDNNKTDPTWWARWCPQLNDPDITSITIKNPSATGSLPRLLLGGVIHEWMGIFQSEDTFTCTARYTIGAVISPLEYREEKLLVKLKTTNGDTKTYKKREQTSYDSGESIPENLASTMYAEWSQLHYDGQITLAAQDAPTGAGPGMTLNITGGRAAWVTMDAMITSVTANLGLGRLEITFGVPQWIDLDSRFAFYRACKSRRYSTTRDLAQAQDQPDPEETDDPSAGITGLPGSRDGGNTLHLIRRVLYDPSAQIQHTITLEARANDFTPNTLGGFDFENPAHAQASRHVHVLETLVPVLMGGKVIGAKRAQVLACSPYGDTYPLDVPQQQGGWGETEIPDPPANPGGGTVVGGDVSIDLNKGADQDAPVRLAAILPGSALITHPCRFIAARYPAQGDESNSLGIVRGSMGGTHSLKPRLANVDAVPSHSTKNRIYGFGTDDDWNLFELEPIFQLDTTNKILYVDPQRMDPGGTGILPQKDLTPSSGSSKWDFQTDSTSNDSIKIRVIVDVIFDSQTLTLKKVYRDITLPKQVVAHIGVPTHSTVLTGKEC